MCVVLVECIIDAGFLLEGSRGIQERDWFLMLFFVQEFERHVNFGQMGTRIGVVCYGRKATLNIKLNEFKNAGVFEKAVGHIPYKVNSSKVAVGLRALRKKLFIEPNGRLSWILTSLFWGCIIRWVSNGY